MPGCDSELAVEPLPGSRLRRISVNTNSGREAANMRPPRHRDIFIVGARAKRGLHHLHHDPADEGERAAGTRNAAAIKGRSYTLARGTAPDRASTPHGSRGRSAHSEWDISVWMKPAATPQNR